MRHNLHNIALSLIWIAVETASLSLRQGDILSVYLTRTVGGGTKTVGYIQGANGVMQLLSALPVGFATDRYFKDKKALVIAAGSLVGLAGMLLCSYGVDYPIHHRAIDMTPPNSARWTHGNVALLVGMMTLGCYRGWLSGPMEAIFTDSTTSLDRTKWFTVKYQVLLLAASLGPFTAIVMFLVYGNTWDLATCRLVIHIGYVMLLPALLVLLLFDDRKTYTHHHDATPHNFHSSSGPLETLLEDEDEAEESSSSGTTPSSNVPSEEDQAEEEEEQEEEDEDEEAAAEERDSVESSRRRRRRRAKSNPGGLEPISITDLKAPVDALGFVTRFFSRPTQQQLEEVNDGDAQVATDDANDDEEDRLRSRGEREITACTWPVPRCVFVPTVVLVSDVIGALASGMTLKYFALFFVEQCQMRPVYVNILGVSSTWIIALFSAWAVRGVRRYGRLKVTLCTRLLDVLLLCAMAVLRTGPGKDRDILVLVHVVRMGLANCSRPIMRTIMMDNVLPGSRARWNAADSVRMFSWSGSAAIGGILIDRVGYQKTFVITAAVKVTAVVPLVMLGPYV